MRVPQVACYGPPAHELAATLASIRAEQAAAALVALHAARLCPEPEVRSMWLGRAAAACAFGGRAAVVAALARRLARPQAPWAPGTVLRRAALPVILYR